MSLAANIEDKITILNTKFLVIGIAKLLFKRNGNDDMVCVYTLKRTKDNSIFYLEDRLTIDSYCLYYKSEKGYNLYEYTIIKRNYCVLDTVGETGYHKYENVKCKYKEKNQVSILFINNLIFYGIFVDNISVEKRNYKDPFESSLPVISKFHEDNKIKNEIVQNATKIEVGNGLLINDE